MHHMSVCGTTFADLLTRFVWGALERLWHLQLCRQMWKERIDAVSPSSQLLVNVYSKRQQPTWNQAHSVPLSFPGLSANAIRANMPTVSGVKNVNGPLSEMWSLSMESCDAFPKFSIPAGTDAENRPAPALSSRGSVIERTPGVLRYLSQRDLGCFNCKNSFVSMWVTRYTNVYSALSPASHRPRCFQGGNTHTEHREQGKQSLGKFQTLHSALSLLTDVALQFYLSSLKAFSLSESFSGTPFDSVGVLKLFSSALAALGGIHGYSIIFLLCHAMQPLFPCHLLTGSTVTAWSFLYIQLSSATSSCLFGSTLPTPLGVFTHVRSRVKTEGSEGSQGRSRVEQEVKWDGGEEKAEITME